MPRTTATYFRSPGRPDGIQTVLDRLVEETSHLLGLEEACVLLRASGRLTDEPMLAGCPGTETTLGRRFCVDQGLVAHVIASGEPMTVADYRQLFWPLADGGHASAQWGAAAPLRWGGRVRGALSGSTTDPASAFEPPQLERLCRVADLGALALEAADGRQRAEAALHEGVDILAAAVDMRDSCTGRHSESVTKLASRVGSELKLSGDELQELEVAARLHDLGKLEVPDTILQKPGELNREEWRVMKRHPRSGAEMLARIPGLERVADIVLHHHERFDGGGYPNGLAGEDIPLAARIITACDAYEAMVSDRPYRQALGHEHALEELHACASGQFDPRAVEALTEALDESQPAVPGRFLRSVA